MCGYEHLQADGCGMGGLNGWMVAKRTHNEHNVTTHFMLSDVHTCIVDYALVCVYVV